jgi:quercetin dioxygenase-like cupin family protein
MDRRQLIAITEIVSERTPRPLLAPVLSFELAEELSSLQTEPIYEAHGHNARTLIKHSEFRLVLIALRTGYRLHEQQIPERLSIQVLAGALGLHIPTETLELRPGQLLALDRGLPFSIEALENSGFLLWLGWSKE